MISKYIPFVYPEERKLPYYITSIGNPKYQPPVFRPNGICDYMFLYFVSGEAECFVDNKKYEAKEGMMFFVPPGVEHNYHMKTEYGETWYITFFGNELDRLLGKEAIIFNIDDDYDIIGKYEELSHLRHIPEQQRNITKLLYSFIIDMEMHLTQQIKCGRKKRSILSEATKFIAESDDVTLSELSEKYGLNKEYFCRIFKDYTGYPVVKYKNLSRIEKAKKLLQQTNKSIAEIALETGFQSHSYFTLQFRKHTGISPTQFRDYSGKIIF